MDGPNGLYPKILSLTESGGVVVPGGLGVADGLHDGRRRQNLLLHLRLGLQKEAKELLNLHPITSIYWYIIYIHDEIP